MNISEASTYERARRLANHALWTIALQTNRLQREEPEDKNFVLRKWADFHFFILALTKLRKAGTLALKVPSIKPNIEKALERFDSQLPYLQTLRNVDQHFDDYAVDQGRDKKISRKSLEVGMYDDQTWHWLGFEVEIEKAKEESTKFFQTIKDSQALLKKE